MRTLYDRLNEYGDSDYYGFHMPGHKRSLNMLGTTPVYQLDITEIDGFDDLHHAEGILKESQRLAAEVYHASESHYLINGSTAGILSAIAGVTRKGDTILVARNCHKSVYHAIYMNGLNPIYLYPGFDEEVQLNTEVSVEDVREALEKNPQIKAVVIVSPTYDGVVSDVTAIGELAHTRGIPLIVDEAHGAHFGFHPYFPKNANECGADIVIHSLHKTLPSLTQTAVLHMNGTLIDRSRVRKYLHMLQTSSPSYILMASIDSCIQMLHDRQTELFVPYASLLQKTRESLKDLKNIRLVETAHYDPSKLVLSVKGTDWTGKKLYEELLNKYHLQLEMAAGTYALAMTSVGDTKEGMNRLVEALKEIDDQIEIGSDTLISGRIPRLTAEYSSWSLEAALQGRSGRQVPLKSSAGCISLEYAYLYPPGIPLVVPGERISEELVTQLRAYKKMGFQIEGLQKEGYIEVWIDG